MQRKKMCAVFNDIAKKIKVMCPEGKGSEICSQETHALKINL